MAVEQRLVGLIADYFGIAPDKVTPTARFVEDLGGDSLDVVAIVIAIEKEYGISIPDAEDGRVSTVQDAADLIERYAGTTPCHVDDRLPDASGAGVGK